MSKSGAGGYGGITTLNQDQRQSRYHPHKTFVRYKDYAHDMYVVKCLDCGETWSHGWTERWAPEECNVKD